MDVFKRIIGSQKAIVTAVGALAVTFGAEAGLAEHVTNAVGALFGVLVVIQGFLDYSWGSKSDGTGRFER